jgi:hypothetical protein
MTLPTFVVIGAMKAGTVSLRHYLDAHPDVFLGDGGMFGEPNFFVTEDNWPRGRGWYESLFDGADRAAAIGECSPCYTWAHVYRGVPERMAQVVPEARLVYVIASEVLRDRPREALSAVFDHLAVDPAAVDLDKRHQDHRSIDKPVPRLHDLGWLPRRQVKLHPRWRPDQRTGLARFLTTRRARVDDSAIPRELRDRLAERLAADLRRFEHLVGHQVPSPWRWSTSASA